jgi:hypothetical protein
MVHGIMVMSAMHETERTRNSLAAGKQAVKEEKEFLSALDLARTTSGQGTTRKQGRWTLQPGDPFRAAPFFDLLPFSSGQTLFDGNVWVDAEAGRLCFQGTLLRGDEKVGVVLYACFHRG